jgi:hypothetical protein
MRARIPTTGTAKGSGRSCNTISVLFGSSELVSRPFRSRCVPPHPQTMSKTHVARATLRALRWSLSAFISEPPSKTRAPNAACSPHVIADCERALNQPDFDLTVCRSSMVATGARRTDSLKRKIEFALPPALHTRRRRTSRAVTCCPTSLLISRERRCGARRLHELVGRC